MKTGKEVKTNNFKNYTVVYGSVNNKHSKAVYINISAWAQPTHENEFNYNRIIRDINKKVKQTLFNIFEEKGNFDFLRDRTIVDLDIRESGIRYGKRSFMNCEITLFLNSETPVNSILMKDILDDIIDDVVTTVFEGNKSFKFFKKKK